MKARRLAWAALALATALLAACGGSDGAAPVSSDQAELADSVAQGDAVNVMLASAGEGVSTSGQVGKVPDRRGLAQGFLGSGSGKVRFESSLPRDGYYDVLVRWPAPAASALHAASVTVNHADGSHTLEMDQSGVGGEWRSIGAFRFTQGRPAVVELQASAGGRFVVEAVRFSFLDSAPRAPAFAAAKLPIALAQRDYETDLDMAGGAPPFRFGVVEGQLPAGMQLDARSGRLDGRPALAGRYHFTLSATDTLGRQVNQAFELLVDSTLGDAAAQGETSTTVSSARKGALQSPPRRSQSVPALTGLRSLVASMPEGSWQRVNLNNFSSVWTPVNLRTLFNGGAVAPSKIILAWSSFAWDSQRGNLFLYGGGHANYRGNDTYLWRSETQMWERGSLPSEMVQTPLGAWNAIDGVDKAPASAHTYDNTLYLPLLDRFLVLGGAADPNGGPYLTQSVPSQTRITGPYLFDPSRADGNKVGGSTGSHVQRVAPFPEVVGGHMWSNRESWLNASPTSTPPMESLTNSCTGYAQENGRDVVYLRTAHRIYRYEIVDINAPSQDRWTQVGRYFFGGSGGQGTCGYDPLRRLMVSTYDSASQPFIFWNLATPSRENRDVLVTPADPSGDFMPLLSSRAIDLKNCAMEYDPVRSNFKLWCGDGRVWTLQPPATASAAGWVITLDLQAVGAVPSEGLGVGILGKWDHIANFDVFMGLADSELGNIWIYKPLGWVSPWGGENLPPVVSMNSPAPGAKYTVGTDIALAASASDDSAVLRVEFLANGQFIGQSASAPYGLIWTAPPVGNYTLVARAIDNQGASSDSATVNIQVDPAPPANVAPTVGWVSPAAGASFPTSSSVTLEANASDSDGQVARVEFFVGGTKLGEATTAPYRWVWVGPPVGTQVLTAMVTDDKGATATSTQRTVTVTPDAGNTGSVMLQRGAPGAGAVQDTFLSSFHRSLAFGGSATMADERQNYRPLLRFAIFQSEGGPVPDGATVTSAVLSVYKSSAYDMTYVAERMLVDWSETAATWNQRLPGVPWGNAGAGLAGVDYAAAPDATGSVGFDPGWVNLDVTAAVQTWSGSGASHNRGWRLRGASGYTFALKWFLASEHNGNAALRPKLTVAFVGSGGNAPPAVSLTAPAQGASFVVGSSIVLTASASDSDGSVARVEFFANGNKLGERTTAPYTFTWASAPVGSHTLTARAVDNGGATSLSSSASITVTAPPNASPRIVLTSPNEGTSIQLGGSFALSANASDDDGSIAKVEFFANGIRIGERSAAPYGLVFVPTSSGPYVLTGRAIDDRGAATTSSVVNVVVTQPPVLNLPPSVSWLAPANGANLLEGGDLTAELSVTDSDGTVVQVELFAGAIKIGQASNAPWRITWVAPPVGTHVLTAVATDDDGATAVTAQRTVQVVPNGSSVTVTLQRGQPGAPMVNDTFLSSFHRNLAFGGSATILDEQQNYRPLLRFAIFQSEGGPVPDGATVTLAVLSVYKSNAYDMTYAAERMLVDWSENAATWNQRLPGVPWGSAGANLVGVDYAAAPDATGSVGFDPGWVNLDVTAAVQTWSVTDASHNRGWRLRGASGYTFALKRFQASEQGANPSLRPKLVITYR